MIKNNNKYIRLKDNIVEHPLFLGLPVRRKAHCYSILVRILSHANFKTGECNPRLGTIARPLGLSNVTVYKCINIMIEGGILLKKRLPSTNMYTVNPEFLYSDIKTVNITNGSDIKTIKGDIKTVNGDRKTVKVLIEHNIQHNIKHNIDTIINNNKGDKDKIVYLIARSIPLPELNNLFIQKIHKYYVGLAIDYHREMLRQKNLLPESVAKEKIQASLKNTAKQKSPYYQGKVKYNKRNGLNWKGEPINK